jgi:hypothetical protein
MLNTFQNLRLNRTKKGKEQGHEASYAAAAAASQRVSGITPLQQQRARKSTVLVYGKATTGGNDTEEILAADLELVATGVSRDATNEQLKSFIVAKGIDVLEIVKLTTFEQARTNTFKIRIKAAQYQKAIDPEMWPLRVGVRHYRQPRRDQNKGTSWAEQAAQSGGVMGQQQSQRRPTQHCHGQPQGHPQYHQQPHAHKQYPTQYHGPPQYQHQGPQYQQQSQPLYQPVNAVPVPVQNRFVADGFATNVFN